MRINIKFSVALHCLVFIAEKQEHIKITSAILAESAGCNPAVIRRILNTLQSAGIITTLRGVGGNYLAKEPNAISLYDVYAAVEPENLPHFIGIHANPSEHCPVGANIENVLLSAYDEIEKAAFDKMKSISLQQIIEKHCATIEK